MDPHLIKIKKVSAPLMRGKNKPSKNLETLLEFSKIEYFHFDYINATDFQELMRLYFVIIKDAEGKEFDDFYFSNLEINKAKLTTILSRFDAKTTELEDYRCYIENDSDENEKSGKLESIDDVLFYYYMILRNFTHYVPEYKIKTEFLFETESDDGGKKKLPSKTDVRRSINVPTNKERIQALKKFCPELWKKLANSNKEIQKQVIHVITGVNLEDSYKLSFGHRNKDLPNERLDKLEQIVSKISE